VRNLPERLAPHHPRSQLLAPLYSHLLANPARHAIGRRLLQDRLLDLTIRMARDHTDYYGASVPKRKDRWNYENLIELPPISRLEAFRHNRELIARITTFGFVTFTSGSTHQPPLLIERSLEEQQYIQNFFTCIQGPLFPKCTNLLAPLGLAEGFLDHGSVLRAPAFGYSFIVDLANNAGQVRAAWLLQQSFNIARFESRISSIQGSFHSLYYLCHFLDEENIQLPPGQLKSIVCFGAPVPLHSRRNMEALLGIPVHDNYSLAEVFGGARYCHDCNAYHFDPFLVEEVLDLQTGKRIDEGSGELILTPLFPFCQRFVLLRYRTADLVETFRTECPQGNRAYRFRGRLQHAVASCQSGPLLGEAEVANAIEGIPEINRADCCLTLLSDSTFIEPPRFEMRQIPNQEGISLSIELRWDPRSRLRELNNLSRQVRQAVLRGVPSDVAAWFRRKSTRFRIEFLPPKSLRDREYWKL